MIAVITGLVVVVVALGGAAFFWYLMQKPLYEPGMVRSGQGIGAPLDPPRQAEAGDFWQVEPDIRLYHFSEGRGPKVLFVHGGPGRPNSRPLSGLQPLTGSYEFVYYDQRGSGRSTRPIDRFSSSDYYQNMMKLDKTLGIGAQVADIERVRRLLGQEKLTIIGHSFGAFLASMYAAEFPENVNALVLVAPADVLVMPQQDGGLFETVKSLLPEEMKKEYTAYLERYLDFGQIFSKSEADLRSLNDEFGRYYMIAAGQRGFAMPAEDVETGGWMAQAMYMSMGRQHDYREPLKRANAPALVVHGAKDLQTEKASRTYADLFPNSIFRVVEGAGHSPFADQPEEFARIVGEFLSKGSS